MHVAKRCIVAVRVCVVTTPTMSQSLNLYTCKVSSDRHVIVTPNTGSYSVPKCTYGNGFICDRLS